MKSINVNAITLLSADQTVNLPEAAYPGPTPEFGNYYNQHRVHSSLNGQTPAKISGKRTNERAVSHRCRWQTHCHGLYELPVAA
jgi:hypothetical protein